MTRDRARDHLFTWLDEDSVFALNTYKSKYNNLNCKCWNCGCSLAKLLKKIFLNLDLLNKYGHVGDDVLMGCTYNFLMTFLMFIF